MADNQRRCANCVSTKKKLPTDIKTARKELVATRKRLEELSKNVIVFFWALEREMKGPSTEQRGRNIAKLCNGLELINDQARYFALGIDYRTDSLSRKYKWAGVPRGPEFEEPRDVNP